MQTQKVKARMVELGISGETMAKELKMNPATFYRKMKNNGNDFSVENLYVFKDFLKMTDQMALDFLLS